MKGDPEPAPPGGPPEAPPTSSGWPGWFRPPGSWFALALLMAVFIGSVLMGALQPRLPDVLRPTGPAAGMDGWTHPLELNLQRRTVLSADLFAVASAGDGQQVWVAGQGRLILHSADGGISWTQQYPLAAATATPLAWLPMGSAQADAKKDEPSPVQQKLLNAKQVQSEKAPAPSGLPPQTQAPVPEQNPAQQYLPDAKGNTPLLGKGRLSVPAAGVDPRVQSNAVAVPPPQAPAPVPPAPVEDLPAAPDALLALAIAPDDLHGWAVGAGGVILAMEDGRHWRAQASGSTETLRAVAFRNLLEGWAVGDNGVTLYTADGGATWQPQEPSTTRLNALALVPASAANPYGLWMASSAGTVASAPPLKEVPYVPGLAQYAVAMSADGGTGWAAGRQGRSQQYVNGRWAPLSYAGATLRALALMGPRLFAASDRGLYARDTGEGGGWNIVQLGSSPGAEPPLRGIHFANAERGWAVGAAGALWGTRDGGKTWHALAVAKPDTDQPYARYPAPVAMTLGFLSLALLVPLVWRGQFKRRDEAAVENAAEPAPGLNADQPLSDISRDQLGHAATVEALSRFIRNAETDPRLTIAVTAPWGKGKSSIMRMLQTELGKAGYRSAWFNAWHHQQEGRPLSALFNVIGQQALPAALPARLWLRFRLIWRRGLLYRALVVVSLAAAAILASDVANRFQGWGHFLRNAEWKVAHHLLETPHVVLTQASLAKLNPCSGAAAGCEPCAVATTGGALRPGPYCYARDHLVWQTPAGRYTECAATQTGAATRCEFRSAHDLGAAIEKGSKTDLSPAEKKAITAAAEPLDPPKLFPFSERLLPAVALVLGLLLTKGVSVYGFELLKPLRALLSSDRAGTEGKEATGVIEKYRTQFGNLSGALKGRLVVFIDDLDRCNEAMVNSVLEMSNYLIDVGECFIVIGADLKFVKLCIKAPGASGVDDAYASRYLRKLVHIEVPVPLTDEASVRGMVGYENLKAVAPSPVGLRAWPALLPRFGWALLFVLALCASMLAVSRYTEAEPSVVGGESRLLPAGRVALPPTALPTSPVQGGAPSVAATVAAAPASAVAPTFLAAPVRGGAAVYGLGVLLLGLLAALWFARPDVPFLARFRQLKQTVAVLAGGAVQTHDPQAFRAALAHWHEPVFQKDGTPRGSKRFRNKARFFGTLLQLQQGEWDARKAQLHAVALVALNFVAPELLETLARPHRDLSFHAGHNDAPGAKALHQTVVNCLERHEAESGEPIPPALVRRFLALAGSIEVR